MHHIACLNKILLRFWMFGLGMGCLYGIEAGIDMSSYASCLEVRWMIISVVRCDIDNDFIRWVNNHRTSFIVVVPK